jgi:hypothetical protein
MSNEASYGEFTRWLGDAYETHQRGRGLDGVVKRNALVQTPGFVSAFMLDRTLTPAIAEFGLRFLEAAPPWKIHVVWGDALLPADHELQPWNRAAQDWTHGGLEAMP